MIFNSLVFWVFFAVVYGVYRALPHRGQNILLLVSSYFFYGWWDWRFLSLIFISTVVDYWAGLAIDGAGPNERRRRMAIWVSMATNLGILGFFKYFNFFADNLVVLLQTIGVTTPIRHLNIILPVGISFYTFQTMSYTLDIYRGQLRATRRFIDFAAFVSFFPQLVAGPIERAAKLLPQIANPRVISREDMQSGAWLVFWGLFKKCVIADNLAVLVDGVFGVETATGATALLALYAFAFQIYCDFSGYSDIARGLARWMGIKLMLNFNNPYFAANPKDFWARWHMSLSTWLRDYLYISLGGNRRGPRRRYVNLMLTMVLGGLWHGAAWTFVVWGAFHGFLLVAYHAWTAWFASQGGVASKRWIWARRVLMFHVVCLGWLFFRAASLTQAGHMLQLIVTNFAWNVQATNMLVALTLFCLPLWVVQNLQVASGRLTAPTELSLLPRVALYAVLILMGVALGNTGGGAFIYFQF
ncbi:MAG: MBOAT family protein [Kiritimatiellae bacterium]|nr:MBOAT family protein [Kiritimatiellia bacterium]MDD4341366.1 MBOAT family protein [Kiritimatiellia bacterium]